MPLFVLCLALPTATTPFSLFPGDNNSTEPVLTEHAPTAFDDCGEIMQPVGFIVSPLYPAQYPNNANCVWTMSLTTYHRIILTFNVFALAYPDVLVLYDNSTDHGSQILIRTGQCASKATSHCAQNDYHSFIAERFSIQFRSDQFGRDNGFNITYETHQIS